MKKIIHRIFFDFNKKGDPFLPYLETWKKELPDFEIMQWSENNLPLDLNEYTCFMTKTKNPAFLSDYFRCWLLTKYGGVYFDTDIEILDGNRFRAVYEEAQRADNYTLFAGVESDRSGGLTTFAMGVKCGETHPLIAFLMHLYETVFTTEMRYFIKKFPIPDLMSLYFMNLEEKNNFSASKNGLFQTITSPIIADNIKIYPQDYFSPVITYNNNMMVSAFSENTCLCHHFAATWTNNANQIGGLFGDLLQKNYYVIEPSLLAALKKRYLLPKRPRKPVWALSYKEIVLLEKIANGIAPYGGLFYSLLRKLGRKK